jgi:hypothetical protein
MGKISDKDLVVYRTNGFWPDVILLVVSSTHELAQDMSMNPAINYFPAGKNKSISPKTCLIIRFPINIHKIPPLEDRAKWFQSCLVHDLFIVVLPCSTLICSKTCLLILRSLTAVSSP